MTMSKRSTKKKNSNKYIFETKSCLTNSEKKSLLIKFTNFYTRTCNLKKKFRSLFH